VAAVAVVVVLPPALVVLAVAGQALRLGAVMVRPILVVAVVPLGEVLVVTVVRVLLS
jgi:hypothetical protein